MATVKQDVEGVLGDVKSYFEDKLSILTGSDGLIDKTRYDLEIFLDALKRTMDNFRIPAPDISIDGALETIDIDVKPDLGNALESLTDGLEALQSALGGLTAPTKPDTEDPGDTPTFDDLSEAPLPDVITLPTLDVGTTPDLPSSPTVDANIDFPDLPTINVPSSPTLPQLTIPADISIRPIDSNDYITVDFGDLQDKIDNSFSQILPIIQDIMGRAASLRADDVWDSEEYQLLLTALRTNSSTGGSGISDEVIQNELLRDVQAREDAITDATRKGAGLGWQLPSGFLLAQVTSIEKEWMDKRMAAFNEISKLELQVRHQTMNTALELRVRLEGLVMDYKIKVLNLIAEVDKAIAGFAITMADTQIKMLAAYTAVLEGQIKQFEAAVKNEMAKVEIFKAQVEAEKAQADLGAAQVELYKGQIQAEDTKIRLYAAQIDGQKARVELERVKIEIFRAQIDAYVSQLKARTAEIEAYEAELKGELSKVDIYKAQADVYKTNVTTAVTKFTALLERQKQILEMNKLKIQAYAGETDAYKSIIQGYSAQADVFGKMAQVQLSSVQTEADLAKVEGQLKIQAKELDFEREKVRLNLSEKAQESILREATVRLQTLMDYNKEMVHTLSSLLAAALSSIGVNAHISASGAASEGYSYSEANNTLSQTSSSTVHQYTHRS